MTGEQAAEPRPLDQLATALAAFQTEMPTVPKSHTATVKSDKGSYSYTYADLADVSEAAMPLLAKHGLSFSTLPGPGALTGMLLHKSGQYLTASLPITGGTPQQVGSSLTYMRRYLLGCMTGIVTDDDDDGLIAQASPSASGRKPAGKAAPEPDDGWQPPAESKDNLLNLAKAAAWKAWQGFQPPTGDPTADMQAMKAHYEQLYAQPFADATTEDFVTFTESLKGKP